MTTHTPPQFQYRRKYKGGRNGIASRIIPHYTQFYLFRSPRHHSSFHISGNRRALRLINHRYPNSTTTLLSATMCLLLPLLFRLCRSKDSTPYNSMPSQYPAPVQTPMSHRPRNTLMGRRLERQYQENAALYGPQAAEDMYQRSLRGARA